MDHLDPAELAAVIAALGAILVLLADRRSTLLAGFAVLAVAELGLVLSLSDQVGADRIFRPAIVALAVPGALLLGAASLLFARFPTLVMPIVLLAAPFRLPLDFDPDNRFFVAVAQDGALGRLLPLYAVLAAAVLGLLVRAARENDVQALPREIALPASALLAFMALSVLWSEDLDAATNRLAYFLLPFTALVAVVGRTPFAPWLPRVLAVTAIGLAVVFAVVGLWQSQTHRLLFSAPSVEVANTYGAIFRVTSLFRDPSLYGRHLVLGIAILLVGVLLARIHLALAAALIALLWMGLYVSYSQSSLAALGVTTVAIAALAGGRDLRRILAVAVVAIAVVGTVLVALEVRNESAQRATSDRSRRVELTARVFAERPLAGVGLAAQPRAGQALDERPAPVSKYVSHTTPLTVAAELGAIGIALYLLLLAGTVRLIDRVRREDAALGLSLAAVLLALFVHSLFYAGFFEDPITWLALGVAAGFLSERAHATEAAPQLVGRSRPEPRPS